MKHILIIIVTLVFSVLLFPFLSLRLSFAAETWEMRAPVSGKGGLRENLGQVEEIQVEEVAVAGVGNVGSAGNTGRKKDYLKLGGMEIIGRIEAPLIRLELGWHSPSFFNRSVTDPERSFQKEIAGFSGKSFLKYKNSLLEKLRRQSVRP